MSRPIKFRAWDATEKKMWFPKAIRADGENFALVDQFGVLVNDHQKDVIEQFTGLHDQDGKEIYEGDIVEVTEARQSMTLGERGKVVWSGYGFTAEDLPPFDWDPMSPCFGLDCAPLKVIGNIHENPELLK